MTTKYKAYYEANKERMQAKSRAWYHANRERAILAAKAWKDANPKRKQEHTRRYNIGKYGVGLEDYDNLLAAQNGKCAICRTPPAEGKNLAVDHCHRSKQVRGLLCVKCNYGLGRFEDNVDLLHAAIAYLERNL